jgi:hypothetical protein
MKYILLITIGILIIICESCKSDCLKFHEGDFKDINQKTGTTFITRKDNIQTERNHEFGYSVKLSVKWINDCTYSTKFLEVTENRANIPFDTSSVMTVEIIQVKENSYLQRTTSNKNTQKYESEIFIGN